MSKFRWHVLFVFLCLAGVLGSNASALTLDLTSPADSTITSTGTVLVTGAIGAATGPVTVSIALDGLTFSPQVDAAGAFSQQVSFSSEGPHTLEVVASDDSATATAARTVSYQLGSVSINNGAAVTGSTAAQLSLAWPNATHVKLLTNNATWSGWQAFTAAKAVTLPAGDGVKTVLVRFRNAGGGESITYSDTILLDSKPPVGTVRINGGAAATTSPQVTLALAATDSNGVTGMRFSTNGITWTAWEDFAASRVFTLPAGTGPKQVYVKFRDGAGKSSTAVTASIRVETVAPPASTTGALAINGDAPFATSTAAALTIVNPDPAYNQMCFSSNGTTWSSWVTVSASKTFTLPSGDGLKTVYVKFRSSGAGESGLYSDTILLDSKAPVGTVVINGGAFLTTEHTATLTLAAVDLNGVTDMQFSRNGTLWTDWEPFAATRTLELLAGDGARSVFVRYRDAAGKISPSVSDTIKVDTTAPTGKVVINAGAAKTGNPLVTLGLPVTGAVAMQLSADGGGSWGSWLPYNATAKVTLAPPAGIKTVAARFRDLAGNVSASATDTISLTFAGDPPPVAAAGSDQNVVAGAVVALDGTASSTASAVPLAYTWQLVAKPADSLAALSATDLPQPTLATDVAGIYLLQLVVTAGTAASIPDTVMVVATPHTTHVTGIVTAPAGTTVGDMLLYSIGETTSIAADGSFAAKAYTEGVAIAVALPPGKSFGLMNVMATQRLQPATVTDIPPSTVRAAFAPQSAPLASGAGSVELSARTTAVSMVFMSPYFLTNDPVQTQTTLQLIESDPKVADLATVIDSVFNEADPLANPVFEQALHAAIQSVWDRIPEPPAAPAQQGAMPAQTLPLVPNGLPYYVDTSFLEFNNNPDGEFYNFTLSSVNGGDVDWWATFSQLDSTSIKTWQHLETLTDDNRSLYEGEPGTKVVSHKVPAQSKFRYFDIGTLFDYALEQVPDLLTQEKYPVENSKPGVYLVRAYSGAYGFRYDPDERAFVKESVPGGTTGLNIAVGVNVIGGVFDGISAFIDLNDKKTFNVRKCVEAIFVPSLQILSESMITGEDDLLKISKDISIAAAKELLTQAIINSKGKLPEATGNYLGQFWGGILTKSLPIAVNLIDPAKKIAAGGKLLRRTRHFVWDATPMETMVAVVGNPFPPTDFKFLGYPDDREVKLGWNSDTGVDKFTIYKNESAITVSKAPGDYDEFYEQDKDASSYTATELCVGETYAFTMTTTKDGQESADASTVVVTMPPPAFSVVPSQLELMPLVSSCGTYGPSVEITLSGGSPDSGENDPDGWGKNYGYDFLHGNKMIGWFEKVIGSDERGGKMKYRFYPQPFMGEETIVFTDDCDNTIGTLKVKVKATRIDMSVGCIPSSSSLPIKYIGYDSCYKNSFYAVSGAGLGQTYAINVRNSTANGQVCSLNLPNHYSEPNNEYFRSFVTVSAKDKWLNPGESFKVYLKRVR